MQLLPDIHSKPNGWARPFLFLFILMVAGSRCAPATPARVNMKPVRYRSVSEPPSASHPKFQPRRVDPYSHSEVYRRIYRETLRWEGTPHRMGGTSRKGVDCSGFVMTLYQKLFQVRLPRTTKDQVRMGQWVPKDALKPGDLVFFHPPKKVRHVGIYLSDGRFVHVSTYRGVTISHLDNPYYRKSYWTARRIL